MKTAGWMLFLLLGGATVVAAGSESNAVDPFSRSSIDTLSDAPAAATPPAAPEADTLTLSVPDISAALERLLEEQMAREAEERNAPAMTPSAADAVAAIGGW